MFKSIILAVFALIACAAAKPGIVAPLAYSAPYVASSYVASPYVASPYVASSYVASPYVASPYLASPYAAAYTAPLLLRK